MSSSAKWTTDGELWSDGFTKQFARLNSSIHHPTPNFWCTIPSAWGNPVRVFDTGLQDYADAKRLVEVTLRLEGKI